MTLSSISRAIGGLLTKHDFNKFGRTWVRDRGFLSDVIDVQSGRAIQGVTVNVAVMHTPTYELAWGKPPPSPFSEVDCVVRTRLGILVDGRDRWWRPDDQSADADMAEGLASSALPFLAAFIDLADVERWLEAAQNKRYPPEALYLAAIKHQRGKQAESRVIIEELLQRTTSGPWRERICGMAASLA